MLYNYLKDDEIKIFDFVSKKLKSNYNHHWDLFLKLADMNLWNHCMWVKSGIQWINTSYGYYGDKGLGVPSQDVPGVWYQMQSSIIITGLVSLFALH